MKRIASTYSPQLKEWLARLGVGAYCQRVIIDIPLDGPVRLYITKLASEDAFEVMPHDIEEAEIITSTST